MPTIPDMLRQLREQGITQLEIARQTGIPQPRLSRWGAGEVPSGAQDALKLRELFESLCQSGAANAEAPVAVAAVQGEG